jgi:hypothetical protein
MSGQPNQRQRTFEEQSARRTFEERSTRRKPSKVEKAFLAQTNFELLDSVLKETTKGNLPQNYQAILVAEMNSALQHTGTTKGLPKSQRTNYVQQLNKAVLANVFKMVQGPASGRDNRDNGDLRDPRDLPSNGRANTGRPIQQVQPIQPRAATTAGSQSHQMGWGDMGGQLASFSPNNTFPVQPQFPKREMSTFQARQMSSKELLPQVPDMHPAQNFNEFPTPPKSTRDRGRVARSQEDTGEAFTRIENERASMFRKNNPRNIDFSLPKSKEEEQENPEDKYQRMMAERQRDDQILSSNKPENAEDIANSAEFREASVSMSQERQFQGRQPMPAQRDSAPAFMGDNFVSGLDESMLMANEVKDTPKASFDKRVSQRHTLQAPPAALSYEPPPREVREQDRYLTIHSRFRDVGQYPSPYNFKLSTENVDSDTSEVTLGDNLLFRSREPGNEPMLDTEDLRNIRVVECLDVSVPKSLTAAFEEPYLWLCIDEWGSANTGTGVPSGAFARLKPVPSNLDSFFVTMRAHVLERHMLQTNNIKDLTFRLLKSDGEEITSNDYHLLSDKGKKIDSNELIYIRCFYPEKSEMTGFQHNIFMYSLKHNKKRNELSFKMYVSDEVSQVKNKIGSYRNEKVKHKLPVNRYLAEGDLFFLEVPDSKDSKDYKYCNILNVSQDTITISIDQIPKNISRIGFLKKNPRGYASDDKNAVNYKGGVKEFNLTVPFDGPYKENSYFFIRRKEQVSYMFRLLQIV